MTTAERAAVFLSAADICRRIADYHRKTAAQYMEMASLREETAAVHERMAASILGEQVTPLQPFGGDADEGPRGGI